MSESKKAKIFPILNLYLDLNVKDKTKAERILKLIHNTIDLPIYIEDIYQSDKNEFTVFCYIVSEFEKTNASIVWTLTTLDKIGEEWYIESPNLKHKEYWKFKGTRLNEWNTFKINGIKKIDFELTNLERKLHSETVIE
jgi:hypothetical protein